MSELKELNSKIASLQKQMEPLRTQQYELQEKQTETKNKKLLGKCFVSQNCYSSGKKWPLYTKVTGVKGGVISVVQIEKDCYGEIEIKASERWGMDDTYKEISKTDYNRRIEKLLDEILLKIWAA